MTFNEIKQLFNNSITKLIPDLSKHPDLNNQYAQWIDNNKPIYITFTIQQDDLYDNTINIITEIGITDPQHNYELINYKTFQYPINLYDINNTPIPQKQIQKEINNAITSLQLKAKKQANIFKSQYEHIYKVNNKNKQLNEKQQNEMARFGGGSYRSWTILFKDQLDYVSEGVEKLIDSLQLVSDEEPHDCLQDAADGVEYIVDFIRDYGAENLKKRGFAGFDEVTVSAKQEKDELHCHIILRTTLGNLQERIDDSIQTGNIQHFTKEFVWCALTSCRSRRNSSRDNTAEFEVNLTIIIR